MRNFVLFFVTSLTLHCFVLLFLPDFRNTQEQKENTSIKIIDKSLYEPAYREPVNQNKDNFDKYNEAEDRMKHQNSSVESSQNAPKPKDKIDPDIITDKGNVKELKESNEKNNVDTDDIYISPPQIVPKVYNDIPSPISTSEFLKNMIDSSDELGPSKDIGTIIRENMQKNYPDGEDGVDFNNMSFKYESYFRRFAKSLYNEWRYPESSAAKGETGIVRVSFSITKDGRVININLLESSGYAALDKEVMRTLKTMKPVELGENNTLNMLHVTGYFIYTKGGEYLLY